MKRIFYVLALALMMLSCSNDGQTTYHHFTMENSNISTALVNNPASASEGTNQKEPKFKFEVMEHDFGKLMQEEKVTFVYKFENIGDAPLIISAVEKTCGCTDVRFPRQPIEPGGKGGITITYDSKGHKGVQNKRVTVKANTNPSTTILRFKAQVGTANNF